MSSVIGTLQILQLQELDPSDFKCIVDAEIGELGCGLYSHVRMADHRTLGWVAIKCFVITGGGPQKRKLEKKIKKELLVLQQAMNNHIVRIHGWVKWPGSMGLVMEYMPGGNLGQFVSDGPDRLPMKVLLRMMYESSEGIAYMHNLLSDQHLVHGDLKPENVLLSPDLHCKMGDFGCAQLIASTGSTIMASVRLEEKDMTLGYAPPKKLRSLNIKPQKEQDTYSFGMLLYVLLAGLLPYQHRSQESAFMELIKDGGRPDTTPIDELKETLSNEDKQILETLQSVMEKCWQQDPSDRPTMIEVRDELQKLHRQQNDADILVEVAETLKTISISIPNADEHQLLPLHLFSPMHGTFLQENIHHIYNIPNVRQAAIGCGTVEFQQSGSDMDSKLPSGRKPTLSEVFESSDHSALPRNVQVAKSCLEKYKVLLKNHKYEEAKTMTTKITSMIEENIDATAKGVREFGEKLRKKKLFLESIAIFDAAFATFEKMGKTEEILQEMRFCVRGMTITNEKMIGDDASTKVTVKNFVIPLMREKLRHIEDTSLVSEQFKCLEVCLVLYSIELSEGLVDEWEECEKTLRDALTRMKDVFKTDVMSYNVYGSLLNNLGVVCNRMSRFEEAASFYKQAADVYKAATDYNDE